MGMRERIGSQESEIDAHLRIGNFNAQPGSSAYALEELAEELHGELRECLFGLGRITTKVQKGQDNK